MRRIFYVCLMLLCLCTLNGCGENEKVQNAQEQVLEAQDDAKQAVEETNERVNTLDDYMKDKEQN